MLVTNLVAELANYTLPNLNELRWIAIVFES